MREGQGEDSGRIVQDLTKCYVILLSGLPYLLKDKYALAVTITTRTP